MWGENTQTLAELSLHQETWCGGGTSNVAVPHFGGVMWSCFGIKVLNTEQADHRGTDPNCEAVHTSDIIVGGLPAD